MRYIRKQGNGGHHLNQSHANPPTTAEEATSRWGSFAYKAAVMDFLLSEPEQYQLCCYSELRADLKGLGYHIEHVENKSQNPARTFDYSNLAASALNDKQGLSAIKTLGEVAFGGHATGKQQGVDMQRFVSCHQADCSRFFAYVSDGRIVPRQNLTASEQDRAQYTIDTLNLNSGYLVTLRRQWWAELDTLFTEHTVKGWSLPDWAQIELLPINGALNSFFSLTRQFFGGIAETTLQHHAQDLV